MTQEETRSKPAVNPQKETLPTQPVPIDERKEEKQEFPAPAPDPCIYLG